MASDLLKVFFEVPPHIASGLRSGELVRHHGVIMNRTGGVVAWLRETGGLQEALANGQPIPQTPSMSLMGMQSLNLAGQFLNLGVSVVGFTVLNRKAEQILASLESLHHKVERIISEVKWVSRKVDLVELAKIKTAVELARRATLVHNQAERYRLLSDANQQFISAGESLQLFLREFVASGRYLEEPEVYQEYLRAGLLSRLGSIQVSLHQDELALADHDLERLAAFIGEQEEDFRKKFCDFDVRVIQKIKNRSTTNPVFHQVRDQFPHMRSALLSYHSEVSFLLKTDMPYQEWQKIGQDERTPDLVLLLPPAA